MKTSRYIQNFYCYQPPGDQSEVMFPIVGKVIRCSKIKQKMNNPRYLGRKLDDSLPDFVTFVVSRFWKWGKRGRYSEDSGVFNGD
ncbi:hypothetical protein [Citrobacter enshiensis]|uniref:hypothetical protein n=1 Tax=Citrobacter enshiensis TaxID=2971264 RepID=UPI0023E7B5BD|nr:hypothetical protein [Citrobacter enshiensis]WET41094.1 hypothetical protein P2W74_02260 [Citrobacter enshiensis]